MVLNAMGFSIIRNIRKVSSGFKIQNADIYLLSFLLFSLPFGIGITSVSAILYCFAGISVVLFARRLVLPGFWDPLLFPVWLFLISLLSLSWAKETLTGIKELETQITLLLVPIIFYNRSKDYRSSAKLLLWSFIAGLISSSLFLIISAIYNSFSSFDGLITFNHIPAYGWDSNFTTTNLSFLIHPTYFSYLLLIANLYLLESLVGSFGKIEVSKKVSTFLLFYFSVFIVLLQSRVGILLLLLLLVLYFPRLLRVRTTRLAAIIIFSTVILTLIFSGEAESRVTRAYIDIKKAVSGEKLPVSSNNGTFNRFWIWSNGLELIAENPVFGTGTGDLTTDLQRKFIEHGEKDMIGLKYNLHNQFLEFWASTGFLGFFIFSISLFQLFYLAIKRRKLFIWAVAIILLISSLFESTLDRLLGVLIFVLVFSFLNSQFFIWNGEKGQNQ